MATQLITISTLTKYWDEAELRPATGVKDKRSQNNHLEAAIADASEQAVSYCVGRYDTSTWTTSTLPAALQRPIAIIAAHDLLASRGSIPERLETMYDHAITYLRDISSGKVSLYNETGEARNSGEADIEQAQSGDGELYEDMGWM